VRPNAFPLSRKKKRRHLPVKGQGIPLEKPERGGSRKGKRGWGKHKKRGTWSLDHKLPSVKEIGETNNFFKGEEGGSKTGMGKKLERGPGRGNPNE